jgi:hypothetical protein
VSFFILAAVLCFIAGFTLLFPGTPLSAIWRIKPDEFAQLTALRPWTGIGFFLLSGIMGLTAWGCLQRRLWGWRMAVAIFAVNAVGDIGQIFAGRVSEGLLGIIVVVAIVLWMTRAEVKAAFR